MCNECNKPTCCCETTTVIHDTTCNTNAYENLAEALKVILGLTRHCHLKFGTPSITDDDVTLIGIDGIGTLEYSQDAINWQLSPTFPNQPAGTKNYFIREKTDTSCIVSGYATVIGSGGCIESWHDVVPVSTECILGKLNYYQTNGCGGFRWNPTNTDCISNCIQDWKDIIPLRTECIDMKLNHRQSDGCGLERWYPTATDCSGCVENWVDKIPLQTECIGGKTHYRQTDGCGNERWNETNLNCGLANCESGPDIRNITEVTGTSMRMNFWGIGVESILWEIRQEADVVKSGQFSPINDQPTITWIGALPAGNYDLYIRGGECHSEWSIRPFALAPAGCIGSWANSNPPVSECRDGFIKDYQEDGCGGTRWQSTGVTCSECTAEWTDVTPAVTDCIAGKIHKKQKDGCGNFQFVETALNCADCDDGPRVWQDTIILGSNNGSITYTLDASGVPVVDWDIWKDGVIVRSGTTNMLMPDGSPRFTPSNRVVVTFTPLTEIGVYEFKIRGGDCYSDDYTVMFAVSSVPEIPIPPVISGPVTPKIIHFSPISDIYLQISGTSKRWVISDISTATLGTNRVFLYKVGGETIRQAFPLTNYLWQSNDTLMIEKYKVRNDLVNLMQLGDQESELLQNASLGSTCAFVEIGFNEF